MCGPLACSLAALPASEGERLAAASAYHGTRLLAYAAIGAACGALGQQPLGWFFDSPAVLLPWMLVVVFVIFGLGLEKRLPRPVALLRLSARLRLRTGRLSPVASGFTLGALTPLLPCGPLYLLFGAALVSGSAVRGAEFALAFGLGTVPLLWLAQWQLQRLKPRIGAGTLVRVQRSLALLAALVLAWRLHGTLPLGTAPGDAEKPLPSCCAEGHGS
jgi:sulfite exporter TauE/SafE